MSIDLIAAALWLPMEPNRKLVLLVLCDRADFATGKCWTGRAEISIKSSLSMKTVTEHLKALEATRWIRRRLGNRRAGETMTYWVSVDRLLEKSAAATASYRDKVRQRLGGESTPEPSQLALSGEDDERLGEDNGNDQGELTDGLSEAASRGTVIPRSGDPSGDPDDESFESNSKHVSVSPTYVDTPALFAPTAKAAPAARGYQNGRLKVIGSREDVEDRERQESRRAADQEADDEERRRVDEHLAVSRYESEIRRAGGVSLLPHELVLQEGERPAAVGARLLAEDEARPLERRPKVGIAPAGAVAR
jgi:DNA-binding transcriptional ArsR family regulator